MIPEYKMTVKLFGTTKTITLTELAERHRKAQEWLERQVEFDMQPIMPLRTGKLIRETKEANDSDLTDGQVVVASGGSYIHDLYEGIRRATGMPIHYSRPSATPHWFEKTAVNYEQSWKDGVERIMNGK